MSANTTKEPGNDDTKAEETAAEAKSRFSSALEEAKAGAAALRTEASEKATAYKQQASEKASEVKDQATAKGSEYLEQAKARGGELAVEGKHKASEALSSLSKVVSDNATKVDENLGPKYGDYTRDAARKLQGAAESLDKKSYDELGDDARTFVKENPGLAVGLAAFGGYIIARLFRR